MSLANKQHAHADRGHDLYETPDVAVRALLKAERLPQHVWEPACGPGAIVRVLREEGHEVHATDLVDYGCPDSAGGVDFLMARTAPMGVGAIVTNPPFKLAGDFVLHALELCPVAIFLLRLAFLESQRRTTILDCGRLARVHVFKKRLPMMHRAGWTGPVNSSNVPFAWFVFDRGHKGPIVLDRISWDAAA